ncbi:MAG: hypothetical protein GF364_09385 [Candidatus Lokiarchaeota archaeon]|nr:hypothetical protein [Candidatus Lokiarchaeota archaeon]
MKRTLMPFDALYQAGLAEVEKKNNRVVNNILFAFTIVSIISVIIDSINFINPSIIDTTTTWVRIFMFLSTSLTILVILLLLFRIHSQQRKNRK